MNKIKLEWISIEVDTKCNIRCKMCPISTDAVKNQGRVSLETISNLCQKAQGWTDKISLAVMGEPLLHPQVPEMIKIIKDHGFSALIWTNGLILNERRAEAILKAGIDKVIFSFEIIDKDLHEEIRQGASYDKVKKNLDMFIEMKNKIRPQTEVSVWNIIPDRNISLDVPENIKEEYKGVELYVSYAMDWHGEIGGDFIGKEEFGEPKSCNQIDNYMSVAWTGEVMACCNDFNHEYILGNINNDSMDDIWFGKARLDLVDKMNSGNLSGINPCSSCSAPYVKEGVDRYFVKNDEEYSGKMASNAAKQVKGKLAIS